MAQSGSYYTLVASLPHLPHLFSAKRLPCSRIQLDRRLSMLEADDREQLELMESLLWWDRQSVVPEPDELICGDKRAQVEQLRNPLLKGFTLWRLELRTLIAALRRRRLGLAPPDSSTRWGVGRWTEQIIANWQSPAFGLEFCFPFAQELHELLAKDQSLEAEKLLMGELWTRLTRLQDDHYFDFEAVALYVMRWHLVERWTHHERDAAIERFDHLVDQALEQQGIEL
ncbi:DUF2764 family protein [Motiliproteus sediminis]|uniref:DUF2764 family protein n=1 Tax=Motiliproteus sediminis TaxID=1468178 RepID=UPI001AEF9898|nr:DUF2764 family protein [Motiliproteus sediminis]